MYEPLLTTPLAQSHDLIPLNLPGFGAPALHGETTLQALADFVNAKACEERATVIIAHSVASIVAALAASHDASPLEQIISLEGNLTAEDAYFSGRAAEHGDPESFRDWFLPRLEAKAAQDPVLDRYRREVAKADPRALWELGCDAHRYSSQHHPGEALRDAAHVTYIFNRDNCPRASMDWLEESALSSVELPGASHWPTVDQLDPLAEAISNALTPSGS